MKNYGFSYNFYALFLHNERDNDDEVKFLLLQAKNQLEVMG